ncbi:MAG: GNAT family N-acetyltransferase, partial [Arenicellales bacterium]
GKDEQQRTFRQVAMDYLKGMYRRITNKTKMGRILSGPERAALARIQNELSFMQSDYADPMPYGYRSSADPTGLAADVAALEQTLGAPGMRPKVTVEFVGEFDEDYELTEQDSNRIDELEKGSGINILRGKEVAAVTRGDNGEINGILYTELTGNEFSFDIIVAPEAQGQGIGSALIDAGISEGDTQTEFGEFGKIKLDVVNPNMVAPLERRGFVVVEEVTGHTLMERGEESILYAPAYRDGAFRYNQIADRFMEFFPEDADIDEVEAELEDLPAAERNFYRALSREDWLGFDYPSQAIDAILEEPDNFDLSTQVKAALGRYINILSGDSESILYAPPISSKQDADYLAAVEAGDIDVIQQMVNDAAGLKPREIFYLGDVEVIRNPTMKDQGQMSREVRSEFPNDTLGTRFTYDSKGNRYIWKAYEGIHSDIEPKIQAREGSPLSQNAVKDETVTLPIVYDKKGNVIPLSQRFDEQKESILYTPRISNRDARDDADYMDAIDRGDYDMAEEALMRVGERYGVTDPELIFRDNDGNIMTPSQRFMTPPSVLTPEKIARHKELEAKYNAGTLTPEEEQEAGRIVEEAARAAGYGAKVFQGQPLENNGEVYELGKRNKNIRNESDVNNFGFYFSPDETTAKQYLGDDGSLNVRFLKGNLLDLRDVDAYDQGAALKKMSDLGVENFVGNVS